MIRTRTDMAHQSGTRVSPSYSVIIAPVGMGSRCPVGWTMRGMLNAHLDTVKT